VKRRFRTFSDGTFSGWGNSSPDAHNTAPAAHREQIHLTGRRLLHLHSTFVVSNIFPGADGGGDVDTASIRAYCLTHCPATVTHQRRQGSQETTGKKREA
jgi:hypothetical protein